ncbi:TetR family transcriptional regulator [Paracidovorax avenae]|uniref:TetR/AcrR family transcriptional regulator n=1 Tax=Paracidovorax avenae TaxID=80867 RepID=UPI000D170613|nr:TetR/AcrR family transcriptional regulator [Paracidovorax avenae]AVS98086.1 TetR family transcriptional regulator [Paracidovorax avenae]AVT05106.1 TetR family transcriptional regulator [Paracidovorax avenae]AVT19311.1 TetR family transcriptional regulator [Paracidovorax avenae]
MKVSKAQAAANRRSILEAASRLYRERGLDGVGVADITRDAGLTHGGLYRHFDSKDALVREACALAFEWSMAEVRGSTDIGQGPQPPGLADRVAAYLSPGHRDHPGQGCPVSALAVDAARAGGDLSEVFAQGIERYIARFAQVVEGLEPSAPPSPAGRAHAMQMLATMVGGLVLARATAAGRPALSDEILEVLRSQLASGPGEQAAPSD